MLDSGIIPSESITLSEPSLQPDVDKIRNESLTVPVGVSTFTITIDLPGDIELGSITFGSPSNIKKFEVFLKESSDVSASLYKVLNSVLSEVRFNFPHHHVVVFSTLGMSHMFNMTTGD
jgi:hypothetical protein